MVFQRLLQHGIIAINEKRGWYRLYRRAAREKDCRDEE